MPVDVASVIMKSTGEWAADVIILVLTMVYACYASCHMVAMWNMRREFLIALRWGYERVFGLDEMRFTCRLLYVPLKISLSYLL